MENKQNRKKPSRSANQDRKSSVELWRWESRQRFLLWVNSLGGTLLSDRMVKKNIGYTTLETDKLGYLSEDEAQVLHFKTRKWTQKQLGFALVHKVRSRAGTWSWILTRSHMPSQSVTGRFRKECVLASRRPEIGIDEFWVSDPRLNNHIDKVVGKWNSLTLCFDLALGKNFIYWMSLIRACSMRKISSG